MCYTYDSLSRLTARTIKNLNDNAVISTETFTYDAAGNIIGADDDSCTYDINNRLTSFNGNTVSYDLDGNMLSNGTLSCIYDSSNRLISAGGHTYTYNAEDVRIRNLCDECCCEDTTYTYDTNAKLSRLLCKTTNNVTTKYVYGIGLIGEEVSNNFKTYHFDFRGSTIAITDANGNITDTFAYDSYGKLISRTGTSEVIFGYNGRDGVVTDDNGLIYMRARYYSPELRRFINADIIAGEISDSTSLNRYSYVNGNPVSYIDPFGLSRDAWIKIGIGVGIVVGLAVVTAVTWGTGTAAIAGAALTGAAVSGTIGAVSGAKETNSIDGLANGLLTGTISGAVSGALTAYSLPGWASVTSNIAIDLGEYGLECVLSGDDFSLSVAAVTTLFGLGEGAFDYVMDTKVVKKIIEKIENNLPRILTDKTYFNKIKERLEYIINRENRRKNEDYADKVKDRAIEEFNDALINEMVVYGAQEVKSSAIDKYFKDPLKESAISRIDNFLTNNYTRK